MMQNPAKITSSPTILNMRGREERVGGIFEQVLSNNFLSRALPEIKNQRKEKRSTLVGKFRRVSISSVKDNSSSDDGCNKLSDALPAFRKLNINFESGSVSISSAFDELDQPYSRKSQGSLDSQDHHLNKSDFQQDKKEGFGRRLSFSPPLCVQRTNDSHHDYIDNDASSDSRQVLLPSLPLSASSSCRNSAQSSPSRLRSSRLGSPKHSRRVSITATKPIEDVSNLNQQLLDALQRGGFTESYSIEKPNISPSLTPLRSPSPSRIPLHSKLKVSLPPDSIALFTPDHLLSTNGLGSVKVNTLAKSPGGRNTAARRSHSIYLLPGSRGNNGKIDKVADTFAELTNKIDCNLAKEEMIVRSDERQRRRSEILSRRVVRTGSTAVATLSACLDVQKKFDEIALRDKTEKSESRRKFWMKVVSALSVAELLVHDLPARLISYRRSKHLRKCSRIILCLFLNHRNMRFQLIKKKLSVHIEKRGGKDELRTVAEILTPLIIRWRLRKAAERLRSFLIKCRTLNIPKFQSGYVSNFAKKVRMIQRCWKSFLVCKKGRLVALCRIWDAYEVHLLSNIVDSKITEERYANLPFMSFLPSPPSQKRVSFYFPSSSQKGSGSIKSNKSINIGNNTISISEKDLKRLSRNISHFERNRSAGGARFRDFIKKGYLKKPSRDLVTSFQISRELKIKVLQEYLAEMRSYYLKNRQNIVHPNAVIEAENLYSITHARDLMHDKSDSIMRLMAVQLEKVRAHPPTWVIDNRDSVCKEVNIQAFAHLINLTPKKALKQNFSLYKPLFESHSLFDVVRGCHNRNGIYLKVFMIQKDNGKL